VSQYQFHHLANRFEMANPENNPCIQTVTGSPTKFNHLFNGALPTFRENFTQIRSFLLHKVANRQTDKQTNKQRRKQPQLAEVITTYLPMTGK